jgi:DNA-binding transcriptional ArsR family regulator
MTAIGSQMRVHSHTGTVTAADGRAGESHIDWSLLASLFIHSTKISIIEAMHWIGQPVSASDLEKVFGGTVVVSSLSYHLKSLADSGIVTALEKRKGRAGPAKTPFVLSPTFTNSPYR